MSNKQVETHVVYIRPPERIMDTVHNTPTGVNTPVSIYLNSLLNIKLKFPTFQLVKNKRQ